jgi:hypothetical protein
MKRIVDNSEKDFEVSLVDKEAKTKVRENSSRRAVYSGFKNIVKENDLVAESKKETKKIKITVKPKREDKQFQYLGRSWYSYAPDNKPDWMPEKVVEVFIEKI